MLYAFFFQIKIIGMGDHSWMYDRNYHEKKRAS